MPVNLSEAFRAAHARMLSFDELAEADRVLICIWELESEVNNGGFHQYYFNSSGDYAYFAPTALRKIGALSMADIVERANAAFGPGGPPTSRQERQARLTALRKDLWDDLDRQFYDYPDDIATLLERTLEANELPRT
jgi:hypothetical protein